jgi:hypothetical protein
MRMRIREIAQSRVRYGYRKDPRTVEPGGWNVGRYPVDRLYKGGRASVEKDAATTEAEGCEASIAGFLFSEASRSDDRVLSDG